MKFTAYILIVVLATSLLFAGDSIIEYFTAKSDGSVITIEWKTSDENAARSFEVERSTTKNIFRKVTTIQAKGNPGFYKYIDSDAFLKNNSDDESVLSKSVYSYRIKIVNKDNTSAYTNSVTVTHDVSGIKRTWGMIKEMFR